MRNQIILADHALTVTYEILQEIENLRIDGDEINAAPQFPPTDIERIMVEIINQPVCSIAECIKKQFGEKSGKIQG